MPKNEKNKCRQKQQPHTQIGLVRQQRLRLELEEAIDFGFLSENFGRHRGHIGIN
jgi:hypothetical protein